METIPGLIRRALFLLPALLCLVSSAEAHQPPKYRTPAGRMHFFEVSHDGKERKVRRVLSIGKEHVVSFVVNKQKGLYEVKVRDGKGRVFAYEANAMTDQNHNGWLREQLDGASSKTWADARVGDRMADVMDVRAKAFAPLVRRGLVYPSQAEEMKHKYKLELRAE